MRNVAIRGDDDPPTLPAIRFLVSGSEPSKHVALPQILGLVELDALAKPRRVTHAPTLSCRQPIRICWFRKLWARSPPSSWTTRKGRPSSECSRPPCLAILALKLGFLHTRSR